MDLGCEESAYDNYEYESEGCDDGGADDYEMYTTWQGYKAPKGFTSYTCGGSYGNDPRYRGNQYQPAYEDDAACDPPPDSQTCTDVEEDEYPDECDDPGDSAYDDEEDLETQDDCAEDCPPPCGDPASQICPLPDPNVQCPPCKTVTCSEDEDAVAYGDHGAQSICGENLKRVNEIIKNITPHTVLDEFMLSIANYTADNGEAMFDAMSNEVNNFKELIKEIYANRNDAVSDLLKEEQQQVKSRYEKMTREAIKKTEETIEKIREILPDFDLALFTADPANYIYSALMESYKRQQLPIVDTISMNPDKDFRVGLHKRTWLMREAERIECENEERMCKLNEMMAQLACLSDSLATTNKKLAAYNRQLESHATCLRNKLAYNETVLNCLADEIEINNMEGEKKADDCPIIEPDDILTPYPSGYDYC